ncbi:hypothetical protein Dsin_001385 [Dipteronia sinensis]|uniref:SWIM-type domain-containing protein n=1 Tax=Dipteronia sinensis TaxID=43782 RepID=A0AAE0B5H6_9ROSI|nr:hypothetical protein Dsin_001385 [Dipteronia sinensis]
MEMITHIQWLLVCEMVRQRERMDMVLETPTGGHWYVVKDGEHDSLVDIKNRTCSCREWDIFQLPCKQTIVVARLTKTNFNSFCHDYYNTFWLQTTYAPPINPVPYVSIWEVLEEMKCMIVLPPKSKRQSGRPKEIRLPSA